MKPHVIAVLVFVSLSCAEDERTSVDSRPEPQAPSAAAAAAADAPDHAMFRPDQVKWKDGPPSLPPGAQVAILEGDPAKDGFFAMRLKLPDGYRIPPHTHPNVERVTVISGTFHLGMGSTFDQAAAPSLPAGSYTYMRPGMQHFAWAEGETVVQVATTGPWKIQYINSADDPRSKK
jgi:anti-sigma factor ChrR (cupin superfamily)